MVDKREFKESPLYQGVDEVVAYELTVPVSWGTATLSSLACKLYEDPDGVNTDVTGTMLSGAASASSQVITTSAVFNLTAGNKYRFEVSWVSSESNSLEAYAIIYAQR